MGTKRYFLSLTCMFFFLYSFAEKTPYLLNVEKKGFEVSNITLIDRYLSDSPHSGFAFSFLFQENKLFSPTMINFSKRERFAFKVGSAKNPTKTSGIQLIKANYDWGMFRHFSPIENLQVLVGGFSDIEIGGRYKAKNTNNPINIDFAGNINLSLRTIYDFKVFKNLDAFRAHFLFESPLLGFMFVTPQGLSYYQMGLSKKPLEQIRFSSFHNRQAARISCGLDFPVLNSIISVGLKYELLSHKTSQSFFREQDLAFSIGYVRKLYVFSKKRPAPENFISY